MASPGTSTPEDNTRPSSPRICGSCLESLAQSNPNRVVTVGCCNQGIHEDCLVRWITLTDSTTEALSPRARANRRTCIYCRETLVLGGPVGEQIAQLEDPGIPSLPQHYRDLYDRNEDSTRLFRTMQNVIFGDDRGLLPFSERGREVASELQGRGRTLESAGLFASSRQRILRQRIIDARGYSYTNDVSEWVQNHIRSLESERTLINEQIDNLRQEALQRLRQEALPQFPTRDRRNAFSR